MTAEEARELILRLLQTKGRATNREMVRLIGGDAELFAEIRETLILEDLARDKDGVGLIYSGPHEISLGSAPSAEVQLPAKPERNEGTRPPRGLGFS